MASCENEIVVAQEDHPQEKENRDEYFNRLPDELIISHIFSKIPDAKSLFCCFMLSKRLGFLVLQSHTISCTIPGWLPFDIDDEISTITAQFMSVPQNLLRSLKKPFRFVRGLFSNSRPSFCGKTFTVALVCFIGAFRSLKSLSVEVAFSGKMTTNSSLIEGGPINISNFPIAGPVVKWKVEHKPQKSGCLVIFVAKSIAPLATGDHDNHEDDQDFDHNHADGQLIMTRQAAYEYMCILKDVVHDAKSRSLRFGGMAPLLPDQLQSIVITDSRKQGKVVFGEAKLAELRSGINTVMTENDGKMKAWSGSVVRLPLSGYVMKEVTLSAMNLGGHEDVEPFVKDALDGEGKVFAEAVTEMLRKPASTQNFALRFG